MDWQTFCLFLFFSFSFDATSAQIDYPCAAIDTTCEDEQQLDNLTDRSMNGRRCFCDEKCLLFGDCCDAPSKPMTAPNDTQSTCLTVPFSSHRYVGIYVHDFCSDGTHCEASDSDLFTNFPAFNKRTHLSYRNILCALCNQENMSNLHFGSFDLSCREDLSRLNKTIHNPLPYFTPDYPDPTIRDACRLTYRLSSVNVTKCIPSVSSCPNGTADNSSTQCSSYMRTLMYGNTLYKNPVCAACNGVDIGKLTFSECAISPLIMDPNLHAMSDAKVINSHGTMTSPTLGYSMTMLLDLNLDDGNTVGTKRKCAEGFVFDPWQEQCRKIVCPIGQVYKDGLCKSTGSRGPSANHTALFPSSGPVTESGADGRNQSTKNNNLVENTSNVYCPRIEFLPNEYYISGQILYVNSSGHSYNLTDVIFNDSIVAVCLSDEYDAYVAAFSNSEIILSIVCFALSLFCLILHFTVYILAGKTKLVPDLNMLSISAAIFAVHLLLLLAPVVQYFLFVNSISCTIVGMLLHYAALCSFSWSSVIAFDITKTVLSLEHPSTTYTNYVRYSIFAWFIPFISLIPAIVIDQLLPNSEYSPIYGRNICWIGRRKSLWIFFGAPVVLTVSSNLVFYLMTSTALWKNYKNKALLTNVGSKTSGKKTQFTLYLKLFMIMALAWITGFAAVAVSPLRYVSIIVNGLQGMYIFLAFSCKKSVIQSIINRRKRIGTILLRINSLGPTLSGQSTGSSGILQGKSPVKKSVSGVTVTTKLSSSSQKSDKRLQ